MEKITLDKLKGFTDEQLSEALGFNAKIEDFKSQIAEADSLKGNARKEVEQEIERMFSPRVYPEDLKYKVEHAKHKASRKDGKGEACYCGCDILD